MKTSAYLGQTLVLDFVTSLPTTGEAATAASVTVRVFEDANDTPLLTPTATGRSGFAGNYRTSIACTTANGFEVGKSYNVVAEATIGGVVARGVVGAFVLAPPVFTGTVQADVGNTATTFKTDRAESSTDHWKDALLCFLTGTLAGQVKKVSAFNTTTDFVTITGAFTGTPSAGDVFLLVYL